METCALFFDISVQARKMQPPLWKETNYDRGYVNAMDKIRVFIESSSKVMYVDTREYKNAETARCAYRNAIALVRAGGIVRVTCNRNELFLIRNDI